MQTTIQTVLAGIGCTSAVASVCCGQSSLVVNEQIRESATWMARCDAATIWALIALVCFGLYAWKDVLLTSMSKKVTEAIIKQNDLYERLLELLKDRK